MYLLDTNIVSELRRVKPHGGVVAWLRSTPESALRISALTLGEIQRGVEKLRVAEPEKAARIEAWADQVEDTFAVLSADARIFRLQAKWMNARPDHCFEDTLIAATAKIHEMTVVTRNIQDFAGFDVPLLNPFDFRMES